MSSTESGPPDHPLSGPPNHPLSGTRTHGHLTDALATAGVTTLRALWFAQQADVDGRPDAARAFRAIADDVTSNAFGLLEHLADVGDPLTGLPIDDTTDHIAAAIEGERRTRDSIDPAAVDTARTDGFPEIADWFLTLSGAAERHIAKMTSIDHDS